MPSPGPHVASASLQTRVLEVVDRLVAELSGGEAARRVNLNDSLERDLGISSLERVELLVRLEDAFAVRLGDEAMTAAETPRDLAQAIAVANPQVAETRPAVTALPVGHVAAPTNAETIVEALQWHAQRSPDRVHLHVREDDGRETPITYGSLWTHAARVADGIAAHGVGPQQTVAIMLRTEPAFFAAFFGTLMAGAVPVPMYPPFRADRIEEYAQRQVGVLKNAEASLLITFSEIERLAGLLLAQAPSLTAVATTDQLATESRGAAQRAFRTLDTDPALIQYTSGSTGQPRGVLLSHANLLANIRALQQGLDVRADDVIVSWLPLYHDMGLIGAWLGSLYVGMPLVVMSPLAFLARPARWLRALHTHRATLSPAPNFAYDLCSQRIHDDEIAGLDLSAVRTLLNGSEAVQPETLERFLSRFAPFGLRRTALAPVYGLAECSVGLAAPPPGRGPIIDRLNRRRFQQTGVAELTGDDDPRPLRVVSCGGPLPGHEIRIADDRGHPIAERRVGRVQFRGPSATSGYYRNPEATRELVGEDGWLETGDLGYIADGELFLTGRRKDLIIKGGRNLQPHEIEEITAQVEGVRKGCVAAFGVVDPHRGTERFVIVAETRVRDQGERDTLRRAVVDRVTTALGVPPDRVELCDPGAVLKTSSGKIRRSATRDAFVSGELAAGRPSIARQWVRLTARSAQAWLRRLGRTALQVGFTGYVMVLLLLTVPIVWVALALASPGEWSSRLVGGWTRMLLRLSGCRLDIRGLERCPHGPTVFVANHASYLDPVLMMAVLPAPMRFAAKGRLATYPVLGMAIRKGGHITIEKGDQSQRMEGAGAVMAPLKQGESLFVFPEGTFVARPGLLPFRLGAFRAAVDTGRPVVPVAIRGTRAILRAGSLLVRPGTITVTLGAPLVPSDRGWQEIVRLRDAARDFIARESGEPG